MLTSRDGEHWSQVDEGQLFSAPELGPVRVAASPTARVAIGSFPNGTGAIWRASADGRWTRPTFPDQRASVVDDIATDATRFLIVGAIDPGTARARGAAWSSSDGLTWRLATFPSGVFPSALAWTGTDFIATGLLRNAAVYWRTRDGVAWSTPQRLPGDAIPARPAAGPEGILIPATLATSSGAWLSADGKTWALEPLPDRLMPFDALAVGGTFMVSGRIDLGAGAGEILVRGSASDPWRPASVAAGFEAPLRLGASPVRLAASPDGRMVIGVDGGVILISEGR